MNNSNDTRFHIKTLAQLRSEIQRLAPDIPIAQRLSTLANRLQLGTATIPNRLAVQPMEGGDAETDGSPGHLTLRRYSRFAAGGFGLIWIEATAFLPDARSNPNQLYLHPSNLDSFARFVSELRRTARKTCGHNIMLILQLSHPGRFCRPDGSPHPFIAHHNPQLDKIHEISADFPVVTDSYLDRLQDSFVSTAHLAAQAGFDAVDIKACHKNLLSELLAAFTRKGKYGGPFENRSRLLLESIRRVRQEVPHLLVTSRINAYDGTPRPYGFGTSRNNHLRPNLSEPVRLAKLLRQAGTSILNVSMDNPVQDKTTGMQQDITADSMAVQGEHPLTSLARIMNITAVIQKAVPDLPVVGRGFSWFRQFIPNVAAGAIQAGNISIAGLGRAALAYPDLANDLLESGQIDPLKCCITCSACIQILRDDGNAGCVIRDHEIYGPEFRTRRHFSLDVLRDEAKRCHDCENATCSAGCPANIDVPAFIRAFARDDIAEAYKVIRKSNILPEMCSHLCPGWLMCEGACIETTLSQTPIRIRDIQYVVSWLARCRGLTGVRVPAKSSGKTVAIVGAGPAGSACAAKLIEAGHSVLLLDRENQLGGTPQLVIRSGRFTGAMEEVKTLLQPAIAAGRLVFSPGHELGRNLSLNELRRKNHAVLLATGLWKEHSLGSKPNGVIDALTFLREIKRGTIRAIPARVAILSGGDSAMDAAVMAKTLGAIDLYVVYAGALSDMHWHMDDGWFKSSNTHMLSLTRPLRYVKDKTGKLAGLEICRTEYGPPDRAGNRNPLNVPSGKSILKVEMVIEAMGLGIADNLKKHLRGVRLDKRGLIRTVGPESAALPGMPGVFAAGGLVNGGTSVVHCIAGGMSAAAEINTFLRS